MQITKIGHCCFVVQIDGVTIVTDPGMFTAGQNSRTGVDVVLITHEHGDHLHVDSVKELLAQNPSAVVVTNASVGALLTKDAIPFITVGDGQSTTVKNVTFEGFGTKHAEIYGGMPQVENTAYMVAGKLFFCGDALYEPKRPVDVLALPVVGPWMKTSEAIEYALAVKPRVAFPIHDWLYRPEIAQMMGRWPADILKQSGIEYVPIQPGETKEM